MHNFLSNLSEGTLKLKFEINQLKTNTFIVYGAGSGLDTLSTFIFSKYNIKPYAVIDEKYSKEFTLEGVLYISPTMLTDRYDWLNTLVIVSISNKKYLDQVIANLDRLGFIKIIHAFDIFEYHLAYSNNNFINNSQEILRSNLIKINNAFELLSDERSRIIFKQLLKFYFSGEMETIDNDPLSEQYFPREIEIKSFSRFINCGSYDGDTIKSLHTKIGKIDELICVEPDINNFKKLSKYISENQNSIAKKILIYPCGLWSEEKLLQFNSGSNVNSSIANGGKSYVQMISIDNVVFNFQPTYINMDIEGSEIDAILGARKTICNNVVDIAIAIYHRPEDLWSILLKINEIKPNYKFYIRNYTGRPAETILYCIEK